MMKRVWMNANPRMFQNHDWGDSLVHLPSVWVMSYDEKCGLFELFIMVHVWWAKLFYLQSAWLCSTNIHTVTGYVTWFQKTSLEKIQTCLVNLNLYWLRNRFILQWQGEHLYSPLYAIRIRYHLQWRFQIPLRIGLL